MLINRGGGGLFPSQEKEKRYFSVWCPVRKKSAVCLRKMEDARGLKGKRWALNREKGVFLSSTKGGGSKRCVCIGLGRKSRVPRRKDFMPFPDRRGRKKEGKRLKIVQGTFFSGKEKRLHWDLPNKGKFFDWPGRLLTRRENFWRGVNFPSRENGFRFGEPLSWGSSIRTSSGVEKGLSHSSKPLSESFPSSKGKRALLTKGP